MMNGEIFLKFFIHHKSHSARIANTYVYRWFINQAKEKGKERVTNHQTAA